MASGGGRQRGKKEEGSNVSGSLLGFIGGAVLGAAAAYGVKKLADYFGEQEEKEREMCYSEKQASSVAGSGGTSCSDYYADHDRHAQTAVKRAESSESSEQASSDDGNEGAEVIQKLHEFYNNYVKINDEDKCEARQVVSQILHHFNRYVNTHMSAEFPVGQMFISDVTSDLMVVKPDHFSIHIPVVLDPKMWTIIDGSDPVVEQRGYSLIKRNLEIFSLGECPYDSYLVEEYLSPVHFNMRLQEAVDHASWPTSHFTVHPVILTDYASIVVKYEPNKQLYIDFIPLISLGAQSFVTDVHPKMKFSPGYENLWRKSFLEEERMKLGEIRSEEGGHQMQCLLTFLALHHSSPEYFGLLKKDVLKTVFYHLAEAEDIWIEETLLERFIDMLKFLEEYLKIKKLPDFFNPYVNVLEQYPDTVMHNLKAFISKIIGNNEFKRLLNRKN